VSTVTPDSERRPVWWQSPRFQTRLLWLSLVVLGAGVIVFVAVRWANTGKSYSTPFTNKPAQDVSGVPKTVKLQPGAQDVARRFILTAVTRGNLREAWTLSGPHIRQDLTLKEWLTGTIPVVPYPKEAIKLAPMKIDYSYRNEAMLEVALLPKAGYKIKPQIFFLGLIKVGKGAKAHWVVDSWVPRGSPAVPSAQAGT
jgi:hypothetical protein